MNPWITVLKAADTAAFWHTHQRRKGEYEEPYINHLIEVAMLVAEATEGQRPDLVMAALLHDSIEDQEVPRCMIAESFGDAVATLVEELTDDKSLPKAERKQRQVDTAHRKSEGAKVVKLADKISNLRAIAASPPAEWSVQLYKSALDLSDIVRCNRLRAASLMVWRCVADLKPGVFDAPLRGCGA